MHVGDGTVKGRKGLHAASRESLLADGEGEAGLEGDGVLQEKLGVGVLHHRVLWRKGISSGCVLLPGVVMQTEELERAGQPHVRRPNQGSRISIPVLTGV